MQLKKSILSVTLILSTLFAIPSYAMDADEPFPDVEYDMEYDESFDINYDVEFDDSIDTEVQSAIDYAVSKIGYPYSMARRDSGNAYDCSSLIYYSYASVGTDLSYNGSNCAAAIANGITKTGTTVSPENIQPGDLIFYSYKKNGRYKNISHMAMYIGNGTQIEASYGRQRVDIRPLSFSSMVMVGRPQT